MHPVGILHNMPTKKTKQSNEEQVSINELKELLQKAQAHAVNLEKKFDVYNQEGYCQTCAKKVKGCEPDKIDQKSVTDAQSSTQSWFSWAFSWVRRQKTEPDGDQIISEITMRSSLQKNTEFIKDCQKKLEYLSQEKQNQDLLNKRSGWKKKAVKGFMGFVNYINPFSTRSEKNYVTIQLYCPQQADHIQSIMTELTETLRCHCSGYGIELKEVIILESASCINLDLPLMVICLHASRLGPDVSGAIREIVLGPNVAVLIVHHKEKFALPTERSDEILLEEEYREIGAIIDVAFMAGKGMYKCDMNNRAFEEIIEFIKRKGTNNINP